MRVFIWTCVCVSVKVSECFFFSKNLRKIYINIVKLLKKIFNFHNIIKISYFGNKILYLKKNS